MRVAALAFMVPGAVALGSCNRARAREPRLFELLPPTATGVTFVNRLPEPPRTDFNILNYLYYYNGGGVAAGDVNGDGLPDLYFTSNLGSNRLYLNKGGYRFEDVTARAGVADSVGWKTGVTMADVNGDGRLDIYVCGVDYLTMHGRNVLYINNGDGTFSDRTAEFGLEHFGYSTQALFFDYDGDGDLDMYLLNHSTHTERGPSTHPQREVRHPRAGDKLFRNDGKRFVDVSERAHIYGGVEGYGLGVVAIDVNLDGCPDLYVANDFQENDFLYINNCDGTFTESIASAVGHTSRFSMGVDAADFNNDGRPDLVVADMLPEREDILKTSATTESFDIFNLKVKAGYHAQYARNTLQLNRGRGRFSEIGYLAGVHATDWSWAPLFADLDNDGYKDLFITNGIYRRPNDLDYITYVGNEEIQLSLAKGVTQENLALLRKMPQVPLPNYAFRNNGDLTFSNLAAAWGLGQPGFSNGAAYVDLDNSGALDLVVNNVNGPASIYRNHAREINGRHYLAVRLNGDGANTGGIGARVRIRAQGTVQLLEEMPTRGFESSVDTRLHFGLGSATRVDTLTVTWPDGRSQTLTNIAADQLLTLRQVDASVATGEGAHNDRGVWHGAPTTESARVALFLRFTDVAQRLGANVKHAENLAFDLDREPLMPRLLSTEGPALAVADVNGDGLDDIYVGGAKWQAGRILVQQPNGTFRVAPIPAFAADSIDEDVDAAFLDANGDGRPDLYVVSGGNEFAGNDEPLRDRLYLNDGKGNFQRATDALPAFFHNGSCVVVGDFNGDGHPDLFVGSRVVARRYGESPRSYLLQNDGTGHFRDVTLDLAPGLATAGMVTSAAWLDYDGDGKLDLIVAGEWMPVRTFHQEGRRFVDRTADVGLAGTEGWWNSITVADVNADGRPDLVLGNVGLNSYVRASASQPARLYVGDFFETGVLKQILTSYTNEVSYPLAGRDELLRLMPQLRSKYPSYASFGASRIDDILPPSELRRASVLEAHVFSSSVAVNNGHGGFSLRALPIEAQFAPISAAVADDLNGDGHTDLVVAGNFYGVQPVLGRYDASYGLLLHGKGDGTFQAVDMEESKLLIEGQVRHMKTLRTRSGKLIAVARNDAELALLEVSR
jgi:hypothetical protein